MLFLEILLVLLVLPAILRPFAPAISLPRWIDFLPAAAVVLAVLTMLFERYPFRLYPAYLLITLTFLFTLPRVLRPQPVTNRPVTNRRRFLPILGAVMGLMLMLTALALPLALPMRWIDPTGPSTVGTVTYEWTDSARLETYSEDPADYRKLAVQFWYPSDQPQAPKGNDLVGAELSKAEASYPLVIFSHGGTGIRSSNTTNYRELASHGYIVASIDHTYVNIFTRFSDGEMVFINQRYLNALTSALGDDPAGEAEMTATYDLRARDVDFTLDQIETLNRDGSLEIPAGRIDMQRVGVFGHSMGGATAGIVCRTDPRCKAALILDGTMAGEVTERFDDYTEEYTSEPFPTPLMMINNAHLYNENPEGYAANRSAYEHATLPVYNLVVEGAEHLNLTDLQLMVARPVFTMVGDPQMALGSIDPVTSAEMLNAYMLAFFNTTLKGQPEALMDGPADAYPFVQFETRN